MSDPEKLFDRGDDFERSLLQVAVDETEERDREARTLAALGLGGPVGPPPVPEGGGGLVGGALGKGIAVVALGGLVIAGAIALRKSPEREPSPAVPVASIATTSVASPSEPQRAQARATGTAEAPLPALPSARRAAPKPAASASAPVANDPSALTREIAALDRVRAALKSGDAEAARAELDRYDRDFPFGSLGPEAKALRTRLDKLAGSGKK
jgi:hypothetical protein